MSRYEAEPATFEAAKTWINAVHRHHIAPQGWKFGIFARETTNHGISTQLVGVVVVGRPVARAMDDGHTLEITRLAVMEGHPNASSFLYGKAVKAAVAMGYKRVITYTLQSEPGTSLRAVKAVRLYDSRGGSWSRPSRERQDKAPLEPKVCWQLAPVAIEVKP